MPKQKKTSKTSAVVGGLKTQPKWKLGFLAVVLVLLVSAMGYAGFSAYKAASLKAKAAGYATVHDSGGYKIQVCKIYTAYGYSLRAIASKPANSPTNASLQTFIFNSPNGLAINSRTSKAWYWNVVTVLDTPAGNNSNWYQVRIGTSSMIQASTRLSLAYTPTC